MIHWFTIDICLAKSKHWLNGRTDEMKRLNKIKRIEGHTTEDLHWFTIDTSDIVF